MKFRSILPCFILFGIVLAGPASHLQKRDDYPVSDAAAKVDTAVANLDSAVVSFTSDPKLLIAAQAEVKSTYADTISIIKASKTISSDEASVMQGILYILASNIDDLALHLASQRSSLVATGQGKVILNLLQDMSKDHKTLIGAIRGVVPEELKAAFVELTAKDDQRFDQIIKTFQQ
jgi:hypothetical protein